MRASIVVLFFCSPLFTIAQTDEPLKSWPKLDAAVEPQISIANPINEFAQTDTLDRILFGLGGALMAPVLHNSPMRLGLSIRYFWSGRESRRVDLVDSNGDEFELESKVRGSMVPVHVHLRIDPMNNIDFPILPYLGGFGGMRFFGTDNKITYDYQDGSEPHVEHNRQVSVTYSYGIELGLHIRIGGAILDFRYERAYGGTAKYLDMSSVEFDGAQASYNRLETRTDVEIYSFGIVITI